MYELPPAVYCNFCRVMDTLPDLDWTRFGESPPAGSGAEEERHPSVTAASGSKIKPLRRPDAGSERSDTSTPVTVTFG